MSQPTFRLSRTVRTLITASIAIAALILTASARADTLTGPISSTSSATGQPGVPAPAVTRDALAGALAQATGLTPSEVTTKRECSDPAPGQAACLAVALVSSATGARVHPHVRRTAAPQIDSSAAFGFPSPAAAPPAASAPSAGTPAYLQQAYDLTYLSATQGAGKTVAIVDVGDVANAEQYLATYRSNYGLPACTTANGCFTKVNDQGKSSPLPAPNSSWEGETMLDLDAVSAICPNCKILLVETAGYMEQAVKTAATWPGVVAVSNSWGYETSSLTGTWTYAGVSVLAATGDWGSYENGQTQLFPAALPGVVAVGGTSLAPSITGQGGRGFGESAWSTPGWAAAGSGCVTSQLKPAYQKDAGCAGRSDADVSADADPNTGLNVYDGSWGFIGGTSLATPLTAAYEAITGITDSTPQWPYTNSGLLNDPASGTVYGSRYVNGAACPQNIAYICAAGAGYDGPTGVGSISGALINGAPGIGWPTVGGSTYTKSTTQNSATLIAGIYPNGLTTSYYWQYGPNTSYGSQTQPVSVGSGTAPVATSDTITGLASTSTYHYRLVATNALGTSYGYDYTAMTTGVPPQNTTPPAVSGTAQQGQTLSATSGTWAGNNITYTYQWQRSTDTSIWANIPAATAATYAPGNGDLSAYIRATVTATNAGGTRSANSNTVGPVTSGAPAGSATINGTAKQGQTLTVSTNLSPAATTLTYSWARKTPGASSWTPISGVSGTSYTPSVADEGQLVTCFVSASNSYGTVTITPNAAGPVLADPPVNTVAPFLSGSAQRTATLTVSQGTWQGAENAYSYQWQRSPDAVSWTAVAGATGTSYTLTQADEGQYVRALISASNPDAIVAAPSNRTGTIVAPYPPANLFAPTLSGSAQRTSTLTAAPGVWTGPNLTYAYRWQRDAGNGYMDIIGATDQTYTLSAADEGDVVRVVVTATNVDGTIQEASPSTAVVQGALPVNTIPPAISGSAQRGQTLNATQGTWGGIGNGYTTQWQRSTDNGLSWTDIQGQTTLGYLLGVPDEGSMLRMKVTATNPDGTATAYSTPTSVVPASPPSYITAPSITGTAQRASTLTANPGSWNGIANTYSYQWQHSTDNGTTWTNIAGQTALSYALGMADENTELRFRVTASNPDGTLTATSAASATVTAAPPSNTTAPALSGTVARAGIVTATQGTWNGIGNSYKQQWQRSADNGATWTNIAGATDLTYTIVNADELSKLRVLVTATNPDGSAQAASSATVTVPSAAPVNTAKPVISGAAARGSVLTVTPGTWTGIGNTYTTQWQRSGNSGATWTNITGASDIAYMLTVADEGALVRVQVSATNADGSASVTTDATGNVLAVPPADTTAPAIAGTVQRASTLSGTEGVWTGAGNAYADQWQRSTDNGATWTNITGATDLSYTLTQADEGSKVRFQVTVQNPDGTLAASSAPTVTVPAAPPTNSVSPIVSGTAARGQTLSGIQGTWGGIGNTYTQQWQRSSDNGASWTNIQGANAASYTVAVADETNRLRLLVTATNIDGTLAVASTPTITVPSAPPVKSTAPGISGTPQRSQTLSATQGVWSGTGNSYAYQWQRSTDNGQSWQNISISPVGTVSTLAGNGTAGFSGDGGPATSAQTSYVEAMGISPNGSALFITDTLDNRIREVVLSSSAPNGVPATGPSYTLTGADVGAEVRVQVTATNPDGTATAASAPTARVQALPPTNSKAPVLSGSAHRGSLLAVDGGTWANADTITYEWQRSAAGTGPWTDITGATQTSYTLQSADENATVRALVTGQNPDGTLALATTATTLVPSEPPTNTIAPVLTGTAQRGQALIATQGTWNGAANSYTTQWQRSTDNGQTWTDITGQTGLTYTLGVGDENTKLRMLVTATNPDGTLAVASAPTSTVQAAPPTNSQAPTLTGGTERTQVIAAFAGVWGGPGNTYTYVWQRSFDNGQTWTNVPGALAVPAYNIQQPDEGARLRLMTTATNPDGTLSVATAPSALITANPPKLIDSVSITGNLERGGYMVVDDGTWYGPDNSYANQWQESKNGTTWTDVTGATRGGYTLTQADEGYYIRAKVTASNPDATVIVYSGMKGPVHAVPPYNTVLPAVTGTLQNGQTLTGTQGTWTGPDNTYTQQWQRSGDGQTWTNITGATGASYTLTGADSNLHLRLVVTATNMDAPSGVPAASVATATVVPTPPQNTTPPSVTGRGALGDQLTANPGWWTPADVTLTVQWQRSSGSSFTDITGATGSAYTAQSADIDHTLRVSVTATNSDGATTVQSQPTSTVLGPPTNTKAPAAPSGTTQDSFTLNADTGTWDQTGLSYNYRWLRCPASATSAADSGCSQQDTGSAHTIAIGDIGFRFAVSVTATGPGGSATATSALSATVSARPMFNTTPPSISGTAQVPGTLSANPGSWSLPATNVAYDWKRCDADGSSNCTHVATASSYPLTGADGAHTVILYATATAANGQPATAHSPALTITAQPLPQPIVNPTVTGTAKRTFTLTATQGSWSNTPTSITSVWQRCNAQGAGCADIPGQTGSTYTLTKADEGYAYTYKVSAANSSGTSTASATPTAPVAAYPAVSTHAPVITGAAFNQDAQIGLAANSATWTAPNDTTYQTSWERCDAAGKGCQTVSGQTSGLYTLSDADVGHTLIAAVTATNPDGAVAAQSAPSPVILTAAPRWKTLPTVTDGSQTPGLVGDALTMAFGTWTGPTVQTDVMQLMRCTTSCTAATSAGAGTSYTATSADLGAILRVHETAANAGGATVVWSARYVGPVLSSAAGTSVLRPSAAVTVKNPSGRTLATAQLQSAPSMSTGGARVATNAAKKTVRTVKVTRAKAIRGRLTAWVCTVLQGTGLPNCSGKATVSSSATVKLTAQMTGKLRVVVVRR